MIREASTQDMEALRSLWKIVFDDDDAFLDSFFKYLFNPAECLIYESEGHIVSMLFMLRATRSSFQVDYPARYIYACATHPNYRKKGIMGKLLEASIKYADKNDIELVLVPENDKLSAYYKCFGFTQTTYLYKRYYPSLNVQENNILWNVANDMPINDLIEIMQTLRIQFNSTNNIVHWPESHLRVMLESFFLQGGKFLIMKNTSQLPIGYALALQNEETVEIFECFSELPQNETILSLRNYYKNQPTTFYLSTDSGNNCAKMPFGLFYSKRLVSNSYLNLALDF